MNTPLVSISCITYNHAPYIRQCLDGFLMQQCDFEYEILIHDDASTDGTSDIIREYQKKYPEIIKPIIQKKNQWSQGVRGINIKFNFSRAKGKYIALCEGDDYWTDPLKLQKQVDFLEGNPEYSLVCGGYKSVDTKTKEEKIIVHNLSNLTNTSNDKYFNITLKEFSKKWYTMPLTLMIRKEDYIKFQQEKNLNKYKYYRDVHLIYGLLKINKGCYLKEVFGVYNKHDGGIYSVQSQLNKLLINYKVYKEIYKYNSSDPYIKILYFRTLINLMKFNKRKSLRHLLEAIILVSSINEMKKILKVYI